MATTNISLQQIHSNYRELVKQVHPDLNPGDPDANNKFNEISEIYRECISKHKEAAKIYLCKISISLQDSILGCDRYFLSNDGRRRYLLKIPSGINNGESVNYRDVQLDEEQFSTLSVKITVDLPNDFFIIANKLIQTVRISFLQSIFGGERNIVGPDGAKLKITIPATVKNGAIFKIKNEGLYNRKTKTRDDLFIKILRFFH